MGRRWEAWLTRGSTAVHQKWHASQRLPDIILRRSFTRPSTALAVIEGLGTRLNAGYVHARLVVSFPDPWLLLVSFPDPWLLLVLVPDPKLTQAQIAFSIPRVILEVIYTPNGLGTRLGVYHITPV